MDDRPISGGSSIRTSSVSSGVGGADGAGGAGAVIAGVNG